MNHECYNKIHFHENDTELGYDLGIYPDDTYIFSGNGGWFISAGEYKVPIVFCPFCGKELSKSIDAITE